ncbi:hypothetical protein CRM22_002391 [Opisthorchis felineus]|uniref:Uncharacterized protein n=1 Tax=Opisthorchis felineus TaxID=147828 RepID=A0A4S2M672_OPIFE|nr:hypothetical protein CRM22_002391 [Opisthorchis felineus]
MLLRVGPKGRLPVVQILLDVGSCNSRYGYYHLAIARQNELCVIDYLVNSAQDFESNQLQSNHLSPTFTTIWGCCSHGWLLCKLLHVAENRATAKRLIFCLCFANIVFCRTVRLDLSSKHFDKDRLMSVSRTQKPLDFIEGSWMFGMKNTLLLIPTFFAYTQATKSVAILERYLLMTHMRNLFLYAPFVCDSKSHFSHSSKFEWQQLFEDRRRP